MSKFVRQRLLAQASISGIECLVSERQRLNNLWPAPWSNRKWRSHCVIVTDVDKNVGAVSSFWDVFPASKDVCRSPAAIQRFELPPWSFCSGYLVIWSRRCTNKMGRSVLDHQLLVVYFRATFIEIPLCSFEFLTSLNNFVSLSWPKKMNKTGDRVPLWNPLKESWFLSSVVACGDVYSQRFPKFMLNIFTLMYRQKEATIRKAYLSALYWK